MLEIRCIQFHPSVVLCNLWLKLRICHLYVLMIYLLFIYSLKEKKFIWMQSQLARSELVSKSLKHVDFALNTISGGPRTVIEHTTLIVSSGARPLSGRVCSIDQLCISVILTIFLSLGFKWLTRYCGQFKVKTYSLDLWHLAHSVHIF